MGKTYDIEECDISYEDKAVMEMKANKAGCDPDIGLQGSINDFPNNACGVWASFVVKCRRKLSKPSDKETREKGYHKVS